MEDNSKRQMNKRKGIALSTRPYWLRGMEMLLVQDLKYHTLSMGSGLLIYPLPVGHMVL
jgi:hypothetical protein